MCSQTAFSPFEENKDVTSILINKKMFGIMSEIKMDGNDKEAQTYLEIIKKLDYLKVFTTTNSNASNKMKTEAISYSKTNNLIEVSKFSSEGNSYKCYAKSDGKSDNVSELVFLVTPTNKDSKTILLWISGTLDLKTMSILAKKLKLPVGDVFENSKK